jgi:endonuclease III-like uncharacterized protein
VIQCNDMFHRISDRVKEESGVLDVKRIYAEYDAWIRQAAKEFSKKQPRTLE